MVERGAIPLRGGVALAAVLWKSGRNVIWHRPAQRGCTRQVRLVARDTRQRQGRVQAIRVTGVARGHGEMRTGQRELGGGVAPRGWLPTRRR
jgi:hypothetical protein